MSSKAGKALSPALDLEILTPTFYTTTLRSVFRFPFGKTNFCCLFFFPFTTFSHKKKKILTDVHQQSWVYPLQIITTSYHTMATATTATSCTLPCRQTQIKLLLFSICVILDQLLNLSVPEFSHLPSRNHDSAHLLKIFWINERIDIKDSEECLAFRVRTQLRIHNHRQVDFNTDTLPISTPQSFRMPNKIENFSAFSSTEDKPNCWAGWPIWIYSICPLLAFLCDSWGRTGVLLQVGGVKVTSSAPYTHRALTK